jgi:hypothetical protein
MYVVLFWAARILRSDLGAGGLWGTINQHPTAIMNNGIIGAPPEPLPFHLESCNFSCMGGGGELVSL